MRTRGQPQGSSPRSGASASHRPAGPECRRVRPPLATAGVARLPSAAAAAAVGALVAGFRARRPSSRRAGGALASGASPRGGEQGAVTAAPLRLGWATSPVARPPPKASGPCGQMSSGPSREGLTQMSAWKSGHLPNESFLRTA